MPDAIVENAVSRASETSQDMDTDLPGESACPSLLQEMTESMALSMLIFLIADLRLMSATGRVRTKFELLALDNDFLQKTSAETLAGISVGESDLGREGLSPAQLMAIVLIEMRQAFDAETGPGKDKPGMSADFLSFANKRRKRRRDKNEHERQERMHKLLKAYADMIGRDLKAQIPHIEARRSMLNLISSQRTSGTGERTSGTAVGAEGVEATPPQEYARKSNPFSQHLRNFNVHTINERRKEMMIAMSARKQIEQVTDAVFSLGNENSEVLMRVVDSGAPPELVRPSRMSNKLSPDQLLKIMIAAVESRDSEKLDFMASFFEQGTISQVMIHSKARVVWFNDWYPVNDLTYAIALDKEKKRLMVVFRGAITRHDWSKAFDADLRMVDNPIHEDYQGKCRRLGIHSGFYEYLFRRRKDTGTTKYQEIANVAHTYGLERIGEDYQLAATGHSLGAALSTTFAFFASTDDRFTHNGPIKLFTFGSPYIGGHDFADCFRHQEQSGKLMYARFYNHNDAVASLPGNFSVTKRGSKFRHVGIGIKIPPVPRMFTKFRKWKPRIFYVGNESCWRSYRRGIGRNVLLNSPWIWLIPRMHSLEETQRRVAEASLRRRCQKDDRLLQFSIEELYCELAGIAVAEKKTSEVDGLKSVLSKPGVPIREVKPLMIGCFDADERKGN